MSMIIQSPDFQKAIPTEFKGVRMRSKGEAVFACCLELCGVYWEYEPPELAIPGRPPPDFLCAWQTPKRLAIAVIEYKPAELNATALGELAKKMRRYDSNLIRVRLLCWGCHSESGPGCLALGDDGEWSDWPVGTKLLFSCLQEALRYRYELKEPVPKPGDGLKATEIKVDKLPGAA